MKYIINVYSIVLGIIAAMLAFNRINGWQWFLLVSIVAIVYLKIRTAK